MATEKRLIDANALIDWIDAGHLRNPLEKCFSEWDVVKILRNSPTVDAVEVVHGWWVVENEESIRCSECCFNRASIKMPLDYCPNCGAKMDGEGS